MLKRDSLVSPVVSSSVCFCRGSAAAVAVWGPSAQRETQVKGHILLIHLTGHFPNLAPLSQSLPVIFHHPN